MEVLFNDYKVIIANNTAIDSMVGYKLKVLE